jgi:hypothetical protein
MTDDSLSGFALQTPEHKPVTCGLRATAPEFVPQAAQMIHNDNFGSSRKWRQIQLTDLFAYPSWAVSDQISLQAPSPVSYGAILAEPTTNQLGASRTELKDTVYRSQISGTNPGKHIELDRGQMSTEGSSKQHISTKSIEWSDKSQDSPALQIIAPIVRSVAPFSAQLDLIAQQTLLLEGTDSTNTTEQLIELGTDFVQAIGRQ